MEPGTYLTAMKTENPEQEAPGTSREYAVPKSRALTHGNELKFIFLGIVFCKSCLRALGLAISTPWNTFSSICHLIPVNTLILSWHFLRLLGYLSSHKHYKKNSCFGKTMATKFTATSKNMKVL